MISDPNNSWTDWIWTPVLGADAKLLALAALTLLLALVIGSSFVIRLPGPASGLEHRQFSGLKQWGWLLTGALVLATPLLCWLGAALVLFPIGQPNTLVLSSRARHTTEGSWGRVWETTTISPEGPRAIRDLIDAGPLIDEICRTLLEEHAGRAWRKEDPLDRAMLSAATLRLLEHGRAKPTSIQTLQGASHRAQPQLPYWVVESVEITVMKAICSRANISEIDLLGTDRRSELGPVWDSFSAYLKNSPWRSAPIRLRLTKQKDSGTLRLIKVQKVDLNPDGHLQVGLLISVPGSLSMQPLDAGLQLKLAGGGMHAAKLVLPPASEDSLRYVEARFTNIRPNVVTDATAKLTLVNGNETLQPELPLVNDSAQPGGHATSSSAPIALTARNGSVADSNLWRDAITKLLTQSDFEDWRNWIATNGWSTNLLYQVMNAANTEAEVRIEYHPGVVLVCPGWAAAEGRTLLAIPDATATTEPLRARATMFSSPGFFSWNGLPLPTFAAPQEIPAAAPVALAGPLLDSINHKRLSDDFLQRPTLLGWGREPRPGGATRPVVVRIPVGAGNHTGTATLIWCSGDEDGLIPWGATRPVGEPRPNPDLIRVGAYWASLLEAIIMAPLPTPLDPAVAPTDTNLDPHPIPLLDASQLSLLRTQPIRNACFMIMFALAAFALVIYKGMKAIPK